METNSKKLNIAMVCDAVTDCTAGSFISTLRFSELLCAQGHKIIFIAAKSPKSPQNDCYKNIKAYRFRSILMPKSEGQYYIAFPTVKEIKKILKEEKIDIVHFFIPLPSGLAAIKAARSLGIKIVAHSHTQPENVFLHLPKLPFIKTLNNLFYSYLYWAYNKADAVIYPTEFAKSFFTKIKPNVKTFVISNGVDIGKYSKTDSTAFFKKFNLPTNTKNILFVGRLHPEKSVDTLVKSVPGILEKQPDIQVWIVGFGHMENELKELAKKLNIDTKISFLGKVSQEDLVMAYSGSDLFVLPSLAELEGMVVLEAMACGQPIVIAKAPNSASAYFVDGNGYLFEPENADDLAKQILKIVSDDNLRAQLAAKSLELSRKYDIRESARRLEEVYYSLLNF